MVDAVAAPSEIASERSAMMARIRNRDTKPELLVRRWLHHRGYRFRIHRRTLPGTPDIVLPRYRTVIMVHGCFWHRHDGCGRATTPHTRRGYWEAKFARNVERDRQNRAALESLGWNVAIIWECDTKSEPAIAGRLLPLVRSFCLTQAVSAGRQPIEDAL